MEAVLMRDCGDGYRRADAGSFSPYAAKTAAYTIVATDYGKTFSNVGASASVTLTLPTPKEGFFLRIDKVPGQAVVLARAASESIDGFAADLTVPLSFAGLLTIVSNGTDWFTDLNGGIRCAEVSIAAGAVRTLRATPVTLVAAPGAGKIAKLLGGILLLDYATAVFTETAYNLAVRYVDGAGVIASQAIETTGFIDQAADTMTTVEPKIDAIAAKAGCENVPLVLHNTGAAEFGGATATSVLRGKVWYAVVSSGW